MEYKYLKTESLPHRLDIILNHPPLNILTGEVLKELTTVLKQAGEDNTLRAVVIKGAGKAWSAGADVAEHLPDKYEEMLSIFGELCELIRTYPIPTVAAVNGLCLGGGCEVASMCDFVIASDISKFGQPEIKVGVLPPIACAHYPRRIGLDHALEIILTGDTFEAKVAHHLGLVSQVVSAEKFDEKVERFVSRMTGNSAVVLRIAKQAALAGFQVNPLRAANGVNDIYKTQLMHTNDAVEGLNAFLEKRTPQWKDE